MLSQLLILLHLVTQPYIGWHPHLTSIHHLGTIFLLASLHSAVITEVPHSWLNGSAGVPAVPSTISMSVLRFGVFVGPAGSGSGAELGNIKYNEGSLPKKIRKA